MSQAHYFWAGVGTAAVAVVFLWDAFRRSAQFQQLHYDIVHFVCSICAGGAGAFFTGAALLAVDAKLGTEAKLTFQGSAGTALFALVWVYFRAKFDPRTITPPPPPPGSWVSLGTATTLEQAAQVIAREVGASVDLSALTQAERGVTLRSEQLNCSTVELATVSLGRLAELAPAGAVRQYGVAYNAPSKRFKLEA